MPHEKRRPRGGAASVADPDSHPLRPTGRLVPAHRLSRRAVHWWMTQNLLFVAPVLAGLATAYVLAPDARTWLRAALAVACPLGVAYILLIPWWRYRVHRWETSGEAVCTTSGWFVREWRVAPFNRIQTLDTKRGPLQQLFGLSAVTVTTGSAAGPVTIDGLDHRLAVDIVERLTEHVRALKEDGT
ncbi:PH domain-containing protein [Streptomyces deserti]